MLRCQQKFFSRVLCHRKFVTIGVNEYFLAKMTSSIIPFRIVNISRRGGGGGGGGLTALLPNGGVNWNCLWSDFGTALIQMPNFLCTEPNA